MPQQLTTLQETGTRGRMMYSIIRGPAKLHAQIYSMQIHSCDIILLVRFIHNSLLNV